MNIYCESHGVAEFIENDPSLCKKCSDEIKAKTCKCGVMGNRDDCPSHRIPEEKYF